MTRLRLGIIGAGIMGERMLRAATEHAADLVEVSGVWDAAPGALDRLGSALPAGARAESAAAVVDGAACVYVATPPGTHIAYADQAFAAGRAVFLEKPLATDVAAAAAFVAQAPGGTHARAAVNFPFASSFAVERLGAWMADGPAPASIAIEVAFATWPRPWQQAAAAWLDAPAEGGFTREVVSHFLFLTRRLIGPLQLEHARVERAVGATERGAEATLRAGDVPVRLVGSVGRVAADDCNSWTVEPGGVRLRDWSWAERRDPDGVWQADAAAAPNERMRPLVLRRQLEGVARMTRGEPHALATLGEALEVQRIVEAILASDG